MVIKPKACLHLQSWNSSSSIELESYFYSFLASLRAFDDEASCLPLFTDLFNICELP